VDRDRDDIPDVYQGRTTVPRPDGHGTGADSLRT
jgi:hypothetical protein